MSTSCWTYCLWVDLFTVEADLQMDRMEYMAVSHDGQVVQVVQATATDDADEDCSPWLAE